MPDLSMPLDIGGTHVQVLRLKASCAHTISITGTTARTSSAFNTNTRAIEVYSDTDCYIQTGDNTIEATTSDHFLPAEHSRVYSIGGDRLTQHTHIAAIRKSINGTLYISELE